MRTFLEQYGVGLFVLVLISILIAFAEPLGHAIKNDITAKVENIEKITNDETEIAKGNCYTIVFDGNGATSGSMKPMEVVCGKEFILPDCQFQKDGEEFAGMWNSKPNGKGKSYFTKIYKDQILNSEIITLYAQWGYRLDLNAMLDGKFECISHDYGTCDLYVNGELVKQNCSDFNIILQVGDIYEIKNIKATKGHTYLGSTSGSLTGTCQGKMLDPRLIFITNTYTITYHANATDVIGSTAISHHTYDKSASLTQNGFTRSSYTFHGWNTAADGSGTTYTDMQEVKNLTDQNNVNIDLYAMWQKN